MAQPPPPYSEASHPTTSLPAHLILRIVSLTFPQTNDGLDQGRLERQRKTLMWLTCSLRFVNRAFYFACMHLLRSTYLSAYTTLIRAPYTSDPFPTSLHATQRETTVLDHFIALKVRQDVLTDDSELHIEREDLFKDIFGLSQPRARLEDLLKLYGVQARIIWDENAGDAPNPHLEEQYTCRNDHKHFASPTKTAGSPQEHTLFSASRPHAPRASPDPSLISTHPPSLTLASRATGFFSAIIKPRTNQPLSSPSFHISTCPSSLTSSPSTPSIRPLKRWAALPFALLSVSFMPRSVGIVLTPPGTPASATHNFASASEAMRMPEEVLERAMALTQGRRRVLVELPRVHEETLEVVAERLVNALGSLTE